MPAIPEAEHLGLRSTRDHSLTVYRIGYKYTDMDIGPLVAAARTRAGLTQQDLARRAGTSQSAIARLERGQGSPSVDTLRRVLAAAGFSLRIDLQPAGAAGDPVVEAYKAGVDRTLIRANLAKTVERRLDDVEAFRKSAAELRASVARMRRRR